ncbi:putative dienelactone hydrolase [Xenococcus sp. PCC 7305]|uniref:alpha/beta hydrolase n=1 Tax=Xenococcus sp. PCC 7305 TaxID=102125 RepID=UPI0002AC66BC|nr:alpha/beta hydrolase [Xenococcus sp. PCC 7305]ELS04386.1 putative dienelactone hydrolase [Xenococcus sp. PCC 7305]
MKNVNKHYPSGLSRWLVSLTLGISTTALMAMPLKAAEKIYFYYSPFIESLRISSLELFVDEGIINQDLGFYLKLAKATEKEQQSFRELLSKRIDIDPVVLSRMLNTDEGERLLNFIGQFINVQGGGNGKYPLRGAIVSAAFDEEGLTLLNLFRQFGTNIQLDLRKSLSLHQDLELIVEGTKLFAVEIAKLSAQEIAAKPDTDFAQLQDLRLPGTYGIEQETWNLTDASRDRTFYVDVYRPEKLRPDKTPVVIISHGLSSQPEEFADKAKHLASYGFFVALPQHPGSDAQYAQDFREGYYQDLSSLNSFIDRPLDIHYTLDELERRNSNEFDNQLDLSQVGLYGHSYGGYTALAVAGAAPTPNFEQLERDCALELEEFNTALLLECRALKLERQDYNFRDERIQAVIANNAVNASIFGEQGLSQIQIPVALGAGSYDPATPFVFEQARSFPWLNSSERYLVLEEGETHINLSKLDGGASKLLKMVPQLQLPSPQLISEYGKAMTLAFFEVYIANSADYLPYLQSSYASYLSEGEKFKTYIITGASSENLIQAIEQWKKQHGLSKR